MAHPNSRLTDALAAAICELLTQGHYRNVAAQHVGIAPSTFARWMGNKTAPYPEFQRLVLAAEAEAERAQLAKITGSPEPADAKWYLARKHPDRWAETRRIDVTGRLDMGLKLNADALKSDDARAHIEALTEFFFANGDDSAHDASESGQ